jgi:gliding motility-associated-like protein
MYKSLLTLLILILPLTQNSKGSPAPPNTPKVNSITQPTCALATGSVVLSDLPKKGTWTLTRSPDGVNTTGTGTSSTISGLVTGTYSYTVRDASGFTSGSSSSININAQPVLPAIPAQVVDCSLGTGKAVVSVTSPLGTGFEYRLDGGTYSASATFTAVVNGTHTITVRNSSGCTSAGANFSVSCGSVNNPAAPIVFNIIQPTCTLSTGSVVLSGLPATGSWILTRYPGTITSTGTGTGTTISGLAPGTYNYTVSNSMGYTSPVSVNIVISSQAVVPSPPAISTIIQPNCTVSTGTVSLTGLPATNSWTLTRTPDGIITTGTGINTTVSELKPGIYSFNLTNSSGCISTPSANVIINQQPSTLANVIVTNPLPVCAPATVNLYDPSLTEGSTKGLTYTYWTNPEATIPYLTPATAGTGTYYISGTTASGCSDIKMVTVTVNQNTLANAGPDQVLENIFVTNLAAADPGVNAAGRWSIIEGTAEFFDSTYAATSVSGLSLGSNILLWAVKDGACPTSYDSLLITVRDFVIPTLITPNHDGKNDYLILDGNKSLTKSELIIFDRRGVRLYKNENYDNKWDGVDFNGNPLPDDTYFYILKTEKGRTLNGYIVLKR